MVFCTSCGEIVRTTSGKCPACESGVGVASATSGMTSNENKGDEYSNAYLSSGLNAGVEKGISRMLGKEADVNEVCIECGKALKDQSDLYIGPEKGGGHVYCVNCYSTHFKKGDCLTCRKPVLGLGKPYVIEETGNIYHQECFKGKSCANCSKVIIGPAVEALDKLYHPDCFTCFNCSKGISGPFLEMNGEPCCRPCYETIKTTKPSQQTYKESSKAVSSNDNKHGANPLGDKFGKLDIAGDGQCFKCNGVVINIVGSPDVGVRLGNNNRILHARCFKCEACKEVITEGKYVTDGGEKAYHPTCQQEITVIKPGGKQLVCDGCSQALKGAYMKHGLGFYHSNCFKCDKCKTSIGTNAYMETDDGRPMCEGCFRSWTEQNKSEKPQPAYRGGLKENPDAKATRDEMKKMGAIPTSASNVQGATIGGRNSCPLCQNAIYPQEQVSGPLSTVWHKQCLRCSGCKKQLDSGAKIKEGAPFCIGCK